MELDIIEIAKKHPEVSRAPTAGNLGVVRIPNLGALPAHTKRKDTGDTMPYQVIEITEKGLRDLGTVDPAKITQQDAKRAWESAAHDPAAAMAIIAGKQQAPASSGISRPKTAAKVDSRPANTPAPADLPPPPPRPPEQVDFRDLQIQQLQTQLQVLLSMAQPTQRHQPAPPAQEPEADRTDELIEAVKMPYLSVDPVRPRHKVAFYMGNSGGQMLTYYHEVIKHDICLVLVYDSRYEGSQYLPPALKDATIKVVTDIDGDRRTFNCVSRDLVFPLGCLDICVLLIASDETDAPDELDSEEENF